MMILSVIILLIRSFILRRKNIPVDLFVEALRNENSGYFEEAVINYETALNEFKKNRSHSNLKNKIIEKLKVLRTVIEYKNKFRFGRAVWTLSPDKFKRYNEMWEWCNLFPKLCNKHSDNETQLCIVADTKYIFPIRTAVSLVKKSSCISRDFLL